MGIFYCGRYISNSDDLKVLLDGLVEAGDDLAARTTHQLVHLQHRMASIPVQPRYYLFIYLLSATPPPLPRWVMMHGFQETMIA